MHVVLVGGTAEALVLAHVLSDRHTVSIVEIEAELGLPVQFPGRVVDKSMLQRYFTDEQISYLMLKSNDDGWGCRWDWVVKHLAANVARKGVQCFTRTRVLSCTSTDAGMVMNLTNNERDLPTHLYADRIVLMHSSKAPGPGDRRHEWAPHRPETFPEVPLKQWFGGSVLSTDASSAQSPALKLDRADGITELWWSESPVWSPARGYFERCQPSLPVDVNLLSFDAVVSRAVEFSSTFD